MKNSDTPMRACPKFDGCSAPICPLDPNWSRRIHRKGEPVCFYLLESVKPGARARFEGAMAMSLYHAIERSVDALCARYAPIRKALARAKRTGARMSMDAQVTADAKEVIRPVGGRSVDNPSSREQVKGEG